MALAAFNYTTIGPSAYSPDGPQSTRRQRLAANRTSAGVPTLPVLLELVRGAEQAGFRAQRDASGEPAPPAPAGRCCGKRPRVAVDLVVAAPGC